MSYGGLQPGRLTAAIAAREPSSLILVPELLRVLVHAAVLGWKPPASLRFIAVGGALVSPELLAQAERAGTARLRRLRPQRVRLRGVPQHARQQPARAASAGRCPTCRSGSTTQATDHRAQRRDAGLPR